MKFKLDNDKLCFILNSSLIFPYRVWGPLIISQVSKIILSPHPFLPMFSVLNAHPSWQTSVHKACQVLVLLSEFLSSHSLLSLGMTVLCLGPQHFKRAFVKSLAAGNSSLSPTPEFSQVKCEQIIVQTLPHDRRLIQIAE